MTRDHIPPIGFFPTPPPPNLIVVPCCEKCNGDFKLDDDAIRAWFCLPLGASPAGEWIFKNKALPGTIGRSLAFQKKMLASMKSVKASNELGEVVVTQLTIPRDRVERFIIRIIKGLLTHHYPNYDYSTASFDVDFIGQIIEFRKIIEPLINQLTYAEKGGEVFQYCHGLTESGQTGVWILAFYHVAIFFITHTTNDLDNSVLCRPVST